MKLEQRKVLVAQSKRKCETLQFPLRSMVGDVHRTLLYGGLFAYPADTKNKDTLFGQVERLTVASTELTWVSEQQ